MTHRSRHFTPILNQQQDLPHPQFPEIPTFSRNFLSMFGFFLKNRKVLESLTGYNRHHDIFQPLFSLRIGFKLCSNCTCWRWNRSKGWKSLRISWKNAKFFLKLFSKTTFLTCSKRRRFLYVVGRISTRKIGSKVSQAGNLVNIQNGRIWNLSWFWTKNWLILSFYNLNLLDNKFSMLYMWQNSNLNNFSLVKAWNFLNFLIC